jgi:hypothetical protein
MTNVILSRKRTIQVETGGTAGVIDTSPPVTLKNIHSLSGGNGRLDKLGDVNANGEINGATLVYDSDNDTYFVKKLNLADTVGDLDGGTF